MERRLADEHFRLQPLPRHLLHRSRDVGRVRRIAAADRRVDAKVVTFWMIVGGLFGFIFLVGVVAQIQKRNRQPFYPSANDEFAVSDRADNPGARNFPL
jgi:hypothetical protein